MCSSRCGSFNILHPKFFLSVLSGQLLCLGHLLPFLEVFLKCMAVRITTRGPLWFKQHSFPSFFLFFLPPDALITMFSLYSFYCHLSNSSPYLLTGLSDFLVSSLSFKPLFTIHKCPESFFFLSYSECINLKSAFSLIR